MTLEEYLIEKRNVAQQNVLDSLEKYATVDEAKFLLSRIEQGRINGGMYLGKKCGCFFGTLAIAKNPALDNVSHMEAEDLTGAFLSLGMYDILLTVSPVETFISDVDTGETPENCIELEYLHQWVSEWIASKNV